MPATYDSIATTTLGSSSAQITFSSIPNTFTDLRLVLSNVVCSGPTDIRFYLNNTTDIYSFTGISGDGTAASSYRGTNRTYATTNFNTSYSGTTPSFVTLDIMSYSGTTNKTILVSRAGDYNGSGGVENIVNLSRSTAVVNRLDIFLQAGTMNAGTTATLYGILRA